MNEEMITIKWYVETGFVGATHEGEMEVEADCTDEEIDEFVKQEVFDRIEWGWEKEEKSEG